MRKLLIVITACIYVGVSAQNVNTKNGNFYVSYTDVAFDSSSLALERSYNSKSAEKGWFGMGWGGPFETHLTTVPGGGAAIFHWGTGSIETFLPKDPDPQALSADINEMVMAAQRKKEVTTPDEIFQLRQQLEEDQDKRIREWKRFVDEGLIEPVSATGDRFESFTNANSYIVFTGERYELYNEESTYWFDTKGRMTKAVTEHDPEIILYYKDGHIPVRMKDAAGNQIDLYFTADGSLNMAIGTQKNGQKDTAYYSYDSESGHLASSMDAGDNYYRYEWDNYYNLVKILYTDSTSTEIEYDEQYFAKKLKRKNGSYTLYEYPWVSDFEYGNKVIQFDSTGKLLKTMSYWYVIKKNELGATWTYKWIIVQDGDSTSYVNNEKYGSADSVYQNDGKYWAYQYDNKGNLIAIDYSSGIKVKVERNGEKLSKFITPKNTYTAVYNGEKIEKLVTAKGDEVILPFKAPFTDTKGIRDELVRVLPAFMATSYWWPLGINDDMLREARKIK